MSGVTWSGSDEVLVEPDGDTVELVDTLLNDD